MLNNPIFIALLRGINVGGHNKIPMADLRQLLTDIGLRNVETYIQSGNVVFQSNETDIKILEDKFYKTIKDFFGFEIPVIIKTRNELHNIFKKCPFSEEKKINSYFAILSETPNEELVNEAIKKKYLDEEFLILHDAIYFYCANGYGRAKFNLNFFERKLEVNATARNYKTMVKLLSLSQTNE